MADDLIPSQIIILSSIVGGLICIALSSIPVVGGIFSIIATILGVICGTNTLRHIGKYSLGTGVPSIVYMLTAAGLPYNSCMGPNEDQYRTLSLSLSNAFLMLIIISIISILNSSYWYIYIIISIIGWLVSFKLYIKYTKQQAALIKWSGLWPNNDEGGI